MQARVPIVKAVSNSPKRKSGGSRSLARAMVEISPIKFIISREAAIQIDPRPTLEAMLLTESSPERCSAVTKNLYRETFAASKRLNELPKQDVLLPQRPDQPALHCPGESQRRNAGK